jgi:hypothetical protein
MTIGKGVLVNVAVRRQATEFPKRVQTKIAGGDVFSSGDHFVDQTTRRTLLDDTYRRAPNLVVGAAGVIIATDANWTPVGIS